MMMELMFKVKHEEDLKNINFRYHTDEVSANNGQIQIWLAYNDFFYDAKKENRNIMVI